MWCRLTRSRTFLHSAERVWELSYVFTWWHIGEIIWPSGRTLCGSFFNVFPGQNANLVVWASCLNPQGLVASPVSLRIEPSRLTGQLGNGILIPLSHKPSQPLLSLPCKCLSSNLGLLPILSLWSGLNMSSLMRLLWETLSLPWHNWLFWRSEELYTQMNLDLSPDTDLC